MTKRGQRTKCTKKRKITGTTWCQALASSFLLLLIKSMLQVEATIEGKQQRHNVEVPFNVNSFILKSPLLSEREKKENFKLWYCLGRKKGGKENTIVWFLSTERPFQGGGRQLLFFPICARRWLITSPSLRQPTISPPSPEDKKLVSPSTQSGRAKYPAWAGWMRGANTITISNQRSSPRQHAAERASVWECACVGGRNKHTRALKPEHSNVNHTHRLSFSSSCVRTC